MTDDYMSMGPTHKVAQSSVTGPGTNVIRGIAVGLESVAIPLVTLVAVGWISNHYLGLYGIALAAVGMLAGTAIVMTVRCAGQGAESRPACLHAQAPDHAQRDAARPARVGPAAPRRAGRNL